MPTTSLTNEQIVRAAQQNDTQGILDIIESLAEVVERRTKNLREYAEPGSTFSERVEFDVSSALTIKTQAHLLRDRLTA